LGDFALGVVVGFMTGQVAGYGCGAECIMVLIWSEDQNSLSTMQMQGATTVDEPFAVYGSEDTRPDLKGAVRF
jgi:hypothetical protein